MSACLPALQVDDEQEDDGGGQQVGDVGEAGAEEGLLQRPDLVGPGEEQVEPVDHRALELRAAAVGGDRVGREGLPDDRLADVGGDEERDA